MKQSGYYLTEKHFLENVQRDYYFIVISFSNFQGYDPYYSFYEIRNGISFPEIVFKSAKIALKYKVNRVSIYNSNKTLVCFFGKVRNIYGRPGKYINWEAVEYEIQKQKLNQPTDPKMKNES